MDLDNEMTLSFASKAQNEGLARVTVTAFMAAADPTLTEVEDVKTAVSEAVTNAIIHGYAGSSGTVKMYCALSGRELYIEISDEGRGIGNIEEAMKPMYTSCPESERSGMGFTVMETFMDDVEVLSEKDMGTTVKMSKRLAKS